MDYVKPADVAAAMINAGRSKLALSATNLLVRGGLARAILAAATSLAVTGAVQTNQPLVGALIFPVGLILIVLLGLDLVTGSFGLLPLPWIESDTDAKTIFSNWGWVFLGNLIGSVVYGALLAIALTNFGATAPAGVAAKIVAIAELVAMRAAGFLTRLTLAWSRDGKEKTYVQHRMREVARDLWAWIGEGAHIYVCGDALRMAKDVENALTDIVAEQSGRSAAEAAKFIADLKAQGRYQADVY